MSKIQDEIVPYACLYASVCVCGAYRCGTRQTCHVTGEKNTILLTSYYSFSLYQSQSYLMNFQINQK